MVPVGVLTSGLEVRLGYLDRTLTSIARSDLPKNESLEVFDDRIFGNVGVGTASAISVCKLFDGHPKSTGVILLQDDLEMSPDWYSRMTSYIGGSKHQGFRQGIISGFSVLRKKDTLPKKTSVVRWTSGPCRLIRREFFEHNRRYFDRRDLPRSNEDGQICKVARRTRFEILLLWPFVCKHFGEFSAVRPGRNSVAIYGEDGQKVVRDIQDGKS